ncbi:sulfatase family protein [Azohydromonas australica]|uniref:sulfatase family protein n=1 Tax=Azohydromonas australica TaxID=364039 RepID=UPI0003FACEA5|nr:sulfatase [Azohydromonas australica]
MKPERKNSTAAVNISRRRLTLAASASLATPAGLTAQEATRSNILFICVDDMDYGLFQHMAQVQRLVGTPGMECANHFISLTLCCPSRATMLRGQFGHNTDIVANGGKFGGFNKFFQDGLESSTIATWLQRSGYRTGLVGKYLNDYPSEASGKTHVPPGWNTWFVPNGGDEYGQYNYDVNDDGRTVHFGSRPQDHFNDVMLQRAQAFLRDAASDPPGRPFFLYVAPFLPHEPFTAPPRYLSLFPDVKAPRPPSFNEADVSDKPVWVQRLPRLDADAIRAIDVMYRKRRQCTQALDDMVAALVSTLRSTGQLANTIVVFTSDNGFFHGEHRIPDDKRRAFEEAIRAPLVMRGPGIPAGRVVRELTANADFAPTFAAIAGVATPTFVDGRSLVPLFSGGPPSRWRQSLLLESQPPEINGPRLSYSGLRTAQRQSFVLYNSGEGEFYDLRLDPYQLQNRYDSMRVALKGALAEQVQALKNARGAALRRAEEVPAGTR